jgi:selenocysteine-specific elongation factor
VRVDAKTARDILNGLSVVWIADDAVMLTSAYEELADMMADTLEKFHAENPTRPGIPEAELNDHLPTSLDTSLFQHLLDKLVTVQTILIQKGHIHLATFTVAGALSEKDKRCASEIEETFRSGGFKPPDLKGVIAGDDARHKIYRYLVDSEVLVPTRDRVQNTTIVFHRKTLQEAKERLATQFPGDALFSASEARTALDTTRKYIIPLLEYLDSVRFTRRNGDKRQVIAQP